MEFLLSNGMIIDSDISWRLIDINFEVKFNILNNSPFLNHLT